MPDPHSPVRDFAVPCIDETCRRPLCEPVAFCPYCGRVQDGRSDRSTAQAPTRVASTVDLDGADTPAVTDDPIAEPLSASRPTIDETDAAAAKLDEQAVAAESRARHLAGEVERLRRATTLRRASWRVGSVPRWVAGAIAVAFAFALSWLIDPSPTAGAVDTAFRFGNALRLALLSLAFATLVVLLVRWLRKATLHDLVRALPDLKDHFAPPIEPTGFEVSKDQRRSGPYSVFQLRELHRVGTIDLMTLVTCHGLPDWRPPALIAGALDGGPPTPRRLKRLAATLAGQPSVPSFADYAKTLATRSAELATLDPRHPALQAVDAHRLPAARRVAIAAVVGIASVVAFGLVNGSSFAPFELRPIAAAERSAAPHAGAESRAKGATKAAVPVTRAPTPATTEPQAEVRKDVAPARPKRTTHAEESVPAAPVAPEPKPQPAPTPTSADVPVAKPLPPSSDDERRERLRREFLK